MAYFLGVDSGGTKTEAWLGDEHQVLGRTRGGTVKFTRVSRDIATGRMRELLGEVAAASGVALSQVASACIGISGYSIAEVRDWAATVVGGAIAGKAEVCGDDEIALDAAFRGGPGILVIGGTGSIVLGRCADDSRYTAGGWGHAIGDEGSGYWIGREALRKVFRACDEGVTTMLSSAICESWGASELVELVGMANARPGPDFAALVPTVVRCAQAGDVMAERLLTKAGNELGKQVEMVWAKMQASRNQSSIQQAACGQALDVAFTGSVVEKVDLVRGRMIERLRQNCAGLRVLDAPANAAEGALWRARRAVS